VAPSLALVLVGTVTLEATVRQNRFDIPIAIDRRRRSLSHARDQQQPDDPTRDHACLLSTGYFLPAVFLNIGSVLLPRDKMKAIRSSTSSSLSDLSKSLGISE